jgi:hypothetical protein
MPPKAVAMTADDIPDMYRIRDSALLPFQSPVSCLLFRPPFSTLIQQRETERLTEGSDTLFFKVVGEGVTIAAMRARMVPQRSDNEANVKPPRLQDHAVRASAWDACRKQLSEAKRESFPNVAHICMYSLRDRM